MVPALQPVVRRLTTRAARLQIAAAAIVLVSGIALTQNAAPQKQAAPPASAQPPGVEIVMVGSEPELHVDGIPFFIHAAQFDYFRIPSDLWQRSLARYRQLGINTIDLRIPWNWHEPSEGEFDFDGHTNPRRNLRKLLKLIAQKHLRLIARPGPVIGDYWRNAGYPPWLLTHAEFQMSASAIIRGATPPDAELMTSDANAAAHTWLANEIHMTHARLWMSTIAKELAPYDSKSLISIAEPGKREGETEEKQTGGPLLFVLLDDAASIRPGSNNSDLWRYLAELREALAEGGLHTMALLNVLRTSVPAAQASPEALRGDPPSGLGFVGDWFIARTNPQAAGGLVSVRSQLPGGSSALGAGDITSLTTLVRSLAKQPAFPPLLTGFSATLPVSSGDVRAVQPPLDDTLLASRILIGAGIRGITYSPLQETLTPAGWETSDASRYFHWDAALDLDGTVKPRARSVDRNGQFVAGWSAMLASSHLQDDVGVVGSLLVTHLVSNELPVSSSQLPMCTADQLCAAALVAATNLKDETATESVEIPDTLRTGGSAVPGKISINLTIPAHDSLLLPIHAPLCATADERDHCSDEIVASGAEFLGAHRDSKTLELLFYAPARASVRLRLDGAPAKVELDGDIRPDYQWKEGTSELEVALLRGAAPAYRRILRIQLPYAPRVPEKPKPAKHSHSDMEYEVFDSVRTPLGDSVSIPSVPPVVLADANSGGRMVIASWNHSDDARGAEFELDGAFHGIGDARMRGGEQKYTRMRFQPSLNPPAGQAAGVAKSDGLLRGNLTFRTGHERADIPIFFLTPDGKGNSHYQYDFDLDGTPEWVLESSRLRLIVSPAEGGRALALVDKSTNDDLVTLDGGFHDFLVPAGTPLENSQAFRGGDFSFNRAYQAEWLGASKEANKDVSLRLTYRQAATSDAVALNVEKTLRLADPETVEALYRVSQEPAVPVTGAPPEAPQNGAPKQQSFVAMVSIPLPDLEDQSARICWQPDSAPTSAASSLGTSHAAEPHCEDIAAGGRPVEVPSQASRAEIECPGRRPLTMEWDNGRVTVMPKGFSADVDLVVPAPPPGEAPREFTLRYTVAGSEK
jgi:hypothetical protein